MFSCPYSLPVASAWMSFLRLGVFPRFVVAHFNELLLRFDVGEFGVEFIDLRRLFRHGDVQLSDHDNADHSNRQGGGGDSR